MKWLTDIMVNFFVRMCIGLCIIFLVNQVLLSENMNETVGINPITAITSGVLGVPGVCLLYGIVFYNIEIPQNFLQI